LTRRALARRSVQSDEDGISGSTLTRGVKIGHIHQYIPI
jgi:hypothetical protein